MRALLVTVLLAVAVAVSGCGARVVEPLDGSFVTDGPVIVPDRTVPPDRGDPPPSPPEDVPPPPPPPEDVPPTPVPCSAEADGMPCASPGTGCSGSGGVCDPPFRCVCGRDGRWQCTVEGPGCDGGTDVPPPPPACSIVGTYEVNVMGVRFFFRFNRGGTWEAAERPGDFGTDRSIELGMYRSMGGEVQFVDNTGNTSCTPMDVGRYTETYDPMCGTLTLRMIEDSCTDRARTLNNARFVRR